MREAREGLRENQQLLLLEAEMGVEPIHVGFADQCLPTWLLRRYRLYGKNLWRCFCIAGREITIICNGLSIVKVENIARRRKQENPQWMKAKIATFGIFLRSF
jgi:hypothetical protein